MLRVFPVFVGHLSVFFGEMSVQVFCPCLIGLFGIKLLVCSGDNSLSVVSFADIFSHFEGYLLILLIVSFAAKAFKFHLFICFYFHYSKRWVTEDLAMIYVKECTYVFL